MRIIYLLFLLFLLSSLHFLNARVSPFEDGVKQRDFQTQNKEKEVQYFDTENIYLPSSARDIESVSITYKNIDGSLDTHDVYIGKSIDWHYPIVISQKEAMRNIKRRYFSLYDFEFFIEGDKFVITSDRKLIRHFLLSSPLSIVIDFERNQLRKSDGVYSGSKNTGESKFTDVSVNSRINFYRVILTLDGNYKYTLKRNENTPTIYTIQLK